MCLYVADLLQKRWGTNLLCDISLFGNRICLIYSTKLRWCAGTMVLVQLPADILGGAMMVGEAETTADHQITYDHAELIQNKLFHDYHIEASIQ